MNEKNCAPGQPYVASVRQITSNRHLNFYELKAVKRNGLDFPYYMASRAQDASQLVMHNPDKGPDGVTIFAVYRGETEKVVLVRQFRYAIGQYVYEFPAGLVEEGEDFHLAAIREMQEETGLILEVLKPDALYEKPYFMTDGLTDERCAMVYGYCSGECSTSGLEDTESLQVILADRTEIRRILKEEQVALSCAYMLLHYLHDKKPFAFLTL